MEFSSNTIASRVVRFVRLPLFLLALASLPFFVLELKTPALNDAEGMYAQIAREMRTTGDWTTPHLNGNRHFDKPPLIYWLIGTAQSVLGETETAARIWPALAAWATISVVGAIGSTLYGVQTGFLSALIYATSLGPYIFGRMVMPDPILIFWIALAILSYSKSYMQPENKGQGPWFWILYAAFGFALLTKGILGFGLAAAIIGLHIILTGRLRDFFSRRLLGGTAVAVVIALPWHMAVARANPDFLGYYVIREHLLRFTGHRYPSDEFLPLSLFLFLTLVWTFPWTGMVPQALVRGIKRLKASGLRNSEDLLPLLWLTVIIGLFAASHSRLEYYALPSIPGFALLIGKLWDEALETGNKSFLKITADGSRPTAGGEEEIPAGQESPSRRGIVMALAVMTALMGTAAAAALVMLGPAKDMISQVIVDAWPTGGWTGSPEQMATLERIRIPTMASFAGAAVFSAGALLAARKAQFKAACGLLAVMMAPFFMLVHWGFQVVEPFESTRPVAEIVLQHAGPSDLIVYPEPHEYMWVGGITFYTGRPIYILKDPQFDGLASRRREPPERFLTENELFRLWNSDKRVIVVANAGGNLGKELLNGNHARLLGQTSDRAILSNR